MQKQNLFMNMNKMKPPAHPNKFEHTETLIKFLGYFVLYGFIGGIVGRCIDFSIAKIKGTRDEKLFALLMIILQIVFNGLFFYFVFKIYKFRGGSVELTFDDWISSTFQGLIFATTLYSVQDQLMINFKILVPN